MVGLGDLRREGLDKGAPDFSDGSAARPERGGRWWRGRGRRSWAHTRGNRGRSEVAGPQRGRPLRLRAGGGQPQGTPTREVTLGRDAETPCRHEAAGSGAKGRTPGLRAPTSSAPGGADGEQSGLQGVLQGHRRDTGPLRGLAYVGRTTGPAPVAVGPVVPDLPLPRPCRTSWRGLGVSQGPEPSAPCPLRWAQPRQSLGGPRATKAPSPWTRAPRGDDRWWPAGRDPGVLSGLCRSRRSRWPEPLRSCLGLVLRLLLKSGRPGTSC